MRQMAPNLFKVNYLYKEYHFTPQQLKHSEPTTPRKSRVDIFKIHHTDHILGLILTFYISFALSARKTALVLRMVFNIEVSHQTVLNYIQAVAYYAHQFNMTHKGPIDDISVGDETYIKIGGEQNYVWFCVSASKRTITAYHLADDRETRSAVTTLKEAFSTASPGQELTFISDGLGSYTEAIHFLNSSRKHNKIKHIQVIGLKDKDDVSEQYRSFKQLIERFNRTYKHHVKPAVGFNSFNGAMALTVLFVTYYNFLRPHMSLNYRTPIQIHQLDGINTIQARWVKLLSMMY